MEPKIEEITPALYIVGTPIGHLGDFTFRALHVLKTVDVIYCEDTRRTLKLLNSFEVKKPVKSCPYFKEAKGAEEILSRVKVGERVAFVSDAGMPALSDPGALLVARARDQGIKVVVIGGVSSLTYFISGAGVELENFHFLGFLPPRVKDREELFSNIDGRSPLIFFESPHRIESTLETLLRLRPKNRIILGKELSKVSEQYFSGTPEEVLKKNYFF